MLLGCSRLAFTLKDAEDAKEKFEKQNQQLSDLEGEVGLLRRRLESLETERDNERASNQRLQEALDLARKVRTMPYTAVLHYIILYYIMP